MTSPRRQEILELLQKRKLATQGEWINGSWSGQCHLKHEHKGHGFCKYNYTLHSNNRYSKSQVVIEPNITLIGTDEYGPILNQENAVFITTAANKIESLCTDFLKMMDALEKSRDYLEKGGSYIVEDGFEEPLCCEHLRMIEETLASLGEKK